MPHNVIPIRLNEVNEGIQSLLTRGFARPSRYKIEIEPSIKMREAIPGLLANDGMIPTNEEVSPVTPTSVYHNALDLYNPGSAFRGAAGLDDVVVAPKPKSFQNIDNKFLRELNFNCEFVSLPGATFSTADDTLRIGPARTFPVLQTFEKLIIGFVGSANMQEFRFFKAWQDMIINKNNHVVGYYKDYICSITISQLNINDEVVLKIKVKEIYPFQITPIQLSYASATQVSKFTVGFSRR